MITIKHVLKDGTQVESIDGKVIKADQFSVLYETINRMQKEGIEQQDETINRRYCFNNG
jgi:hypothetical protein